MEEVIPDALVNRSLLFRPAETGLRDGDPSIGNSAFSTGRTSIVENVPSIDITSRSLGPSPRPRDSQDTRKCSSSLESVSNTKHTATAPCKLRTHLAVNPRADITQIITTSDDAEPGPDIVNDGVPCSRAYRMLMHYATTEQKLDAITDVLEEGCVPDAGPGGGCKVKSTTIWKALDRVCL